MLNPEWEENTGLRLAEESPLIELGARKQVKDMRLVCETYASDYTREREENLLGTISGRVTDPSGQPLPNAYLLASTGDDYFSEQVDSNGYFTLKMYGRKHRDSASVRVMHRDYMALYIRDMPMGTENLEAVLYPPHVITGTVENARTGEAIQSFSMIGHMGAGIGPESRPPRLSPRDRGMPYFDPAGRFEVRAATVGAIGYWFRAEGFAPAHRVVVVEPARPAQPLDVKLEPEKTLRGIILDPAGKPVAEAAVAVELTPDDVRLNDRDIFEEAKAWTGNDGRFLLTGLGGERISVWVSHPEYLYTHQEVDLEDAAPELTLVVPYPGVVTGHVTVNGQAAAGQRVYASISLEGSSTTGEETRTDEAGRYTFERLRPGKVTFHVDWDNSYGISDQDYRTVEVRSGETINIDFVIERYARSRGKADEGFYHVLQRSNEEK